VAWEKPVDLANTRLEAILATLQQAHSLRWWSTVERGLVDAANDILYDGIVSFPGSANAVVIEANINTQRTGEEFIDARTYRSGRHQLYRFLKAVLRTEELPAHVEHRFVMNLPYTYSTGVFFPLFERHRADETVEFVPTEIAKGTPYIRIQAGAELDTDLGMFLYPEEVRKMAFSSEPVGQFTPRMPRASGPAELAPATDPVKHYLDFRYFFPTMESLPRLLIPPHETRLVALNWDRRFLLEDHPVFVAEETREGITLYTCYASEVGVPKDEVDAGRRIVAHAKRETRYATQFTGNDIVHRLHNQHRNRL